MKWMVTSMDFYNQMNAMQDGYPQEVPQMRHVPKSEMKDALCAYIMQSRRGVVTKIWEVDEITQQCRHACSKFGLSVIQAENFSYMGITVPFWYCSHCGSLRVWLDYD